MKDVDLSIIIANYNHKDLIEGCIRSIHKHTKGITYEILLIDDCSTDGSAEFVKRNFTEVRLIVNKKNIGPVASNNLAIQQSMGRYIVIYDNDTLLVNNTFKKMVDYLDRNQNVGAAGCNLVYKDGSFQKSMGALLKPSSFIIRDFFLDKFFPNNKITNTYLETPESHKKIRKVTYVKGVCCMMRRKMLKEIGLADEQYYMYGDEIDWYYKMLKNNWDIVHLPYGPVIHFGGSTGMKNKKQEVAEKFQLKSFYNVILFYKKNYGLLSSLAYRTLMFLSLSTKTILLLIKFNKNRFNNISKNLKLIKVLFKRIDVNPKEPLLES